MSTNTSSTNGGTAAATKDTTSNTKDTTTNNNNIPSNHQLITEGSISMLYPVVENSVFYNPVQVQNRDLSILMIGMYTERRIERLWRINKKKEVRKVMLNELDMKKKNMCYAYQRGECPHGINCKFSHNPEFGGKRSNGKSPLDKEKKDGSDAAAKNHVNDDEGTESKERKEKSLRKKNGSKGWRNK